MEQLNEQCTSSTSNLDTNEETLSDAECGSSSSPSISPQSSPSSHLDTCEKYNPPSLLQLDVSPKYLDLMTKIKEAISKDDLSQNTFDLTTELLRSNPMNYAVWSIRRDIIRKIKPDLLKEREFLDDIMIEETKSYQLWNQRQYIISLIIARNIDKDVKAHEIAFIESILGDDPKNFHAWTYRGWFAETISMGKVNIEEELTYTEKLIKQDIHNNSAWSYRLRIDDRQDVAEREFGLLKFYLPLDPECQSMWSHALSLVQKAIINKDDDITCNAIDNALESWLGELIKKETGITIIKTPDEGNNTDDSDNDHPNEQALAFCLRLLVLGNRLHHIPNRAECKNALSKSIKKGGVLSKLWKVAELELDEKGSGC